MTNKILIIEDEYPAAERLAKMISSLEDAEVVATLDSIETSIAFLSQKPDIDLIFSDIHLSDGLSFIIFEKINPIQPIIFTTSYDEYALKAFKTQGIDYLLKPIKAEELQKAYQKYKDLYAHYKKPQDNLQALLKELKPKTYPKRFLVKYQEQIIPIPQEDIAYFFSSNKMVCLVTKEAKQYLVDYTLEQLEDLLNPTRFFRLNRQFLASLEAIEKIHHYFNGKLKLDLCPPSKEEVLVSREKSSFFQQWLISGN